MALVQCKECGREVSSSARKCPHCGVPGPGVVISKTVWQVLGVLLAIAVGLFILNTFGPR